MTASAALLTVLLPLVAAAAGLPSGRWSRPWAREWAVLGTLGALIAACVELYGVNRYGPVAPIGFLGPVDTGGPVIRLDLQASDLTAVVAVTVGVVAVCVQLYSVAYLHGEGTPDAPTRYPAYAATVSLFTAAMMVVVHADDLVLLLIGWEVMGLASYLLVGHHSERPAARAAAVKAFLVTRVGDVGVLLAVVLLLVGARTTAIDELLVRAQTGALPHGIATAAALLLLAGVAGKSAQFPLHTWLPDAMEGPTPVSALIHAATMVAAGVYLVARLLPLYLAAPVALAVAAVIASISMLGAALAALAQEDLKRLLAWSTISQVAYMLGAVSVAQNVTGSSPAIFHLISHAAFKALLFLVAGCVIMLTSTPLMTEMGGLARRHPWLALAFGLGLAGLAGLPPLGGFWSKEGVLTAAEQAAHDGQWTGWMVYLSGLLTTVVTGMYAGRAWTLVAMGRPGGAPETAPVGTVPLEAQGPDDAWLRQLRGEPPGESAGESAGESGGGPGGGPGHEDAAEAGSAAGHPASLPVAMTLPLVVLAIPTVFLGLVLINPPRALAGVHIDLATAVTGSLLALAGVGWALSAPRLGSVDIADALPARLRLLLRDGYGLDGVQDALVVRPARALARVVARGDQEVVDAYVRAGAASARAGGAGLRLAQGGLVTSYLVWVMAGAVIAGVAGVLLS